MDTFGARLQDLRKDAGLTQKQLGEILNVSSSTVTKWESQKYRAEPDIANLEAIADYFSVSLDYLRCRDDLSRSLRGVERYYKGVFTKGQLTWLLGAMKKFDEESRREFFRYAEFLSEKVK